MSPTHGFSSRLSVLFYPILRVLGMTTQPEYDELFNGAVRDWHNIVEARCMIDPVIRGRYEDKSLPVRMIKRYKESSLSGHEYLVAEIAPKGHSYVYLQLDRSKLPDSTPPSKLTSTSTSINSDWKRGAANDQVKVIRSWPEKGTRMGAWASGTTGEKDKPVVVIEEMTFQNTTLHDLVIVAYTLHSNNPTYELFDYQCYWFADLIVRILARCDPSSRQTSVNSTVQAEVEAEEEKHYRPSTTSRWFGIPIHEAKQKNLEELTELFEGKRQQFRIKIDTIIERETAIDEADKRAEAEARRADAEAMRADNLEERVRTLEAQIKASNLGSTTTT